MGERIDAALNWVHNKADEAKDWASRVSEGEAEAIEEVAECEATNQINCNQEKCVDIDFSSWDSTVHSVNLLKLGAKQVVSITAQKVSDWTKKE